MNYKKKTIIGYVIGFFFSSVIPGSSIIFLTNSVLLIVERYINIELMLTFFWDSRIEKKQIERNGPKQ